MLSAIAVQKRKGRLGLPGEPFFDLAEEIAGFREGQGKQAFWDAEVANVYASWSGNYREQEPPNDSPGGDCDTAQHIDPLSEFSNDH